MQIHWPLVISTVCQRVGLGLFICAFVGQVYAGSPVPLSVVAWITLALLAVGGIASVFHLQRPQRFFNAFSNLKSHLTQEALITPFLGVALLVCALNGTLFDLGVATAFVGAVTAILAGAFLVCTGLAYQMGSRRPVMPVSGYSAAISGVAYTLSFGSLTAGSGSLPISSSTTEYSSARPLGVGNPFSL